MWHEKMGRVGGKATTYVIFPGFAPFSDAVCHISFSVTNAAAFIDQSRFDSSLRADSAGTGFHQRGFRKTFSLVLRNTI